MPVLYYHPNNCGMRDLVISSAQPEEVLKTVCRACVQPKFLGGRRVSGFAPIGAHIIFSQAARKGVKITEYGAYGDKLANYIEKHGLGTVLRSEQVLNPDHGPNYITAYIWTLNPEGMQKWWEANKPKEAIPAPEIGSQPYRYSDDGKVPIYCPGLPPVKEGGK